MQEIHRTSIQWKTPVDERASTSTGTSLQHVYWILTTSFFADTPAAIRSSAPWIAPSPSPTISALGLHFIDPLARAGVNQRPRTA